MTDDEHNHEAGDEIAQGIATTPDAAPPDDAPANPWEMRLAPGEMSRLLGEETQRKTKDEVARLKAKQDEEAALDYRESRRADGGGDVDEYSKADLAREEARIRAPIVFERGRAGNPITEEERQAFLELFTRTGLWNQSAYKIGRSGRSFRQLAAQDPIFAVQVGEAVQDWRECMQGEIIRRGYHGTLEPVFGGKDGDLKGYVRRFSDQLLKMEMEASWPSRYRTNQQAPIDLGSNAQTGVMVVPGVASSAKEWQDEIKKRGTLPSPDAPRGVGKTTRPLPQPRGDKGGTP